MFKQPVGARCGAGNIHTVWQVSYLLCTCSFLLASQCSASSSLLHHCSAHCKNDIWVVGDWIWKKITLSSDVNFKSPSAFICPKHVRHFSNVRVQEDLIPLFEWDGLLDSTELKQCVWKLVLGSIHTLQKQSKKKTATSSTHEHNKWILLTHTTSLSRALPSTSDFTDRNNFVLDPCHSSLVSVFFILIKKSDKLKERVANRSQRGVVVRCWNTPCYHSVHHAIPGSRSVIRVSKLQHEIMKVCLVIDGVLSNHPTNPHTSGNSHDPNFVVLHLLWLNYLHQWACKPWNLCSCCNKVVRFVSWLFFILWQAFVCSQHHEFF